jgi:hypothetical protein
MRGGEFSGFGPDGDMRHDAQLHVTRRLHVPSRLLVGAADGL